MFEEARELHQMPIQLTPEQERRVQAVVDSGAYSSAREAIDAALAAVEIVTAEGFEGGQVELESLLLEGLESRELSEEEFWDALDRRTTTVLPDRRNRGQKQ